MALSIISKINLDMKAPNAEIAYGNQYDSAGYINAQLLNDGEKWAVPAGAVAIVSYFKSDRIGGYYDTTSRNETAVSILASDRSVVTIALDQQTMTTVGNVSMQINFYQNNQRLSTFAFILNVKPSPITSSNIDSKWFGNLLILSGVVVDDTLHISGAAADSAIVGNRLTALTTNLEDVSNSKVNKPRNNPYGTAGQILTTLGNQNTEWTTVGTPSDAQVGAAVEAWLDEHPEATTTVLDGSVTSKKLNAELQEAIFGKPFLNVADYGILPDTDEDLYEPIFDFLHDEVPSSGAVVYFPEGRYITSDCIFIPQNTTFMGAGKETIIYFTGEYGYMGVGLSNGGNNVTICNMSVEHVASPNVKTERNRSYFGGIGYSTFDFSNWDQYHKTTGMTRSTKKCLKAIDIWSDSTYVLQTEPNDDYGITDVYYKNINAPYSLVSLHPHDNAGYIHDAIVENVICGLFRCGVGYDNVRNIRITNIQCSEAQLEASCEVDNMYIDPEMDPEWTWWYYTLTLQYSIVIRDSTIKYGSRFDRAINNYIQEPNYLYLENVKIEGYSNAWVNSVSNPGHIILTNCDFGTATAYILRGFIIGSTGNFTENSANAKTLHNLDKISTITSTGGITVGQNNRWSDQYFPCRYTVYGNIVNIQGAVVLNDYENLFSINSNYARQNEYLVVTLMKYEGGTITKTTQVLAICDENGVFKINSLTQNISEYNRAIFEGSYILT